MGITVAPRGGGRGLIPGMYAAGTANYDEKQRAIARDVAMQRERITATLYGQERQIQARQQEMQFQDRGLQRRDERRFQMGQQENVLQREQQLEDVAAQNVEWQNRFEAGDVVTRRTMGLKRIADSLENQPWDEQQGKLIRGKLMAVQEMMSAPEWTAEHSLEAVGELLNEIGNMVPLGKKPENPLDPEVLAKTHPYIRQEEDGTYYMGNVPMKPVMGARGLNFDELDVPSEPQVVNEFDESKAEYLKLGRTELFKHVKAVRMEFEKLIAETIPVPAAQLKAKPGTEPSPKYTHNQAMEEAERRLAGELHPAAQAYLEHVERAEQGGDLPRVNSEADILQLPPGTRFVMPSGRIGERPNEDFKE